jgi:SAM-dependent methyltransferase
MTLPSTNPDIRGGAYARKQLFSGSSVVAWSHTRRFELALDLAKSAEGKRLLDYGCGDGSFLALLLQSGVRPSEMVGAELALDLVVDCRQRLGSTGITFLGLADLDTRAPESFDVIFCMEVLEHVPAVDEVLERMARLLVPGGRLVISVPVETGLPLIVKQVTRRVAGWRGIGDYPGSESYRPMEWLPSLFAGPRQHIQRKVHLHADGTGFHDHKGFNWMALRERLRAGFVVEQVLASPFSWLPPHLATQAWFVTRKRSGST